MTTQATTEAPRFMQGGRFISSSEALCIAKAYAEQAMWDPEELEAYWCRLNDSQEDPMERAECAETVASLTRDELEIFVPE